MRFFVFIQVNYLDKYMYFRPPKNKKNEITHSDPVNLVSVISMKIIEKDYKEQVEKILKLSKLRRYLDLEKGKHQCKLLLKNIKRPY